MTGRCAVRACFQPTPLARVPSSMSAIGVRLHAGSLRSTSMDALCISGGAHVEAVAALFRLTELLCLSFWRSAGECSDRVAMADSVRGLKRYKVHISGRRCHLFRGSVGVHAGLRFLHPNECRTYGSTLVGCKIMWDLNSAEYEWMWDRSLSEYECT